jgi:hypothetical protein
MYKEHKRLRQQAISFFLIILLYSCNSSHKGMFEVIKYHKSDYKWPCFLKIQNNKYYVIDNIRRYKDGKLIEYEGCASEGKFVRDFTKSNKYTSEDKKVKKLSIYKKSNQIIFYDEEFQIVQEKKDSVFVKSKSEEKYYVFVGKIPSN